MAKSEGEMYGKTEKKLSAKELSLKQSGVDFAPKGSGKTYQKLVSNLFMTSVD